MLLLSGLWYTSKIALDKISKIPVLVGPPVHKTPHGLPVLVFDSGVARSLVVGPGISGPAPGTGEPRPCLVPQNEAGHDLMMVNGNQVVRVELNPSDLPDLARLIEFDHLPETRKAGAVAEKLYKPGDKLA